MPKKNRTACKRQKCQRSRSQRRRRNNNRRTRTIRGGSCFPWFRSSRVAPAPSSTDSPQTRPSNPHIASAIDKGQQVVRDSRATREEIAEAERNSRRERAAAALATQREQAAELRKVGQAIRHAQHEVDNAARVTNQEKAKIEAARKSYDAAVKNVPNHKSIPYGATAQSRGK